jgi:hypothetical protein
VRDYLRTDEMQEYFANKTGGELESRVSMLKSTIAMVKRTPRVGENLRAYTALRNVLLDAWYYAEEAEILYGQAPVRLLIGLVRTLVAIGYLPSTMQSAI